MQNLQRKINIAKIFLDTNIILDYLERRNNQSIILIERIKEKKIDCYCSLLLLLELLDVQKDTLFFNKLVIDKKATINEFLRDRHRKYLAKSDFESLNEKLEGIIEALRFTHFYELSVTGWDMALAISSKTNLLSQDVVHFATAITLSCDVLVTRDMGIIKEGKLILQDKEFLSTYKLKKDFMKLTTPEQVNKFIK